MTYFTPFLPLLFLPSWLCAINLNPDAYKLFDAHKVYVRSALSQQKELILNRSDAESSVVVATTLLGIDKMLSMLDEMASKRKKNEITDVAIDKLNQSAAHPHGDQKKIADHAVKKYIRCVKLGTAIQAAPSENVSENHRETISDCMAMHFVPALLKDPSLTLCFQEAKSNNCHESL